MEELALHLLDIAENSVAAGAKRVEIVVEEDAPGNRIRLSVRDDGRGMDAQMLARVADPFVTTRATRVAGLGIPFLKAAAEACNGGVRIVSSPGAGTCLEAEFERDHFDRMPMGDLAGTILALLVGWPEVEWRFHYMGGGETFAFESRPILEVLGEVPLTEPAILGFVRGLLEDGVAGVRRAMGESPD